MRFLREYNLQALMFPFAAATSLGDVSLDAWASLEGMLNVVRRTGHSSYYVEKGIGAMGKLQAF